MKSTENKKKRKMFSIKTETYLVILFSLLIFAIFAGLASNFFFMGILGVSASSSADTIAVIAADCVDGDYLDEYLQTQGTSDESVTALRSLQAVCDDAELNYVYLIKPDFENNTVTGYLSVRGKNQSDLPEYSDDQSTAITSNDFRESFLKIMSDESQAENVYRIDATNAHVTGMVPVRNSDDQVVGIMCAEASFAKYQDLFTMFNIVLGTVAVIILLVSGFVSSRLIRRQIIKPVKQITEETKRFAETKTLAENSMDKALARNNELGQLASSIDSMEYEIVTSIDNIKKMTVEQEHMNAELYVAANVQASALPHDFPAFPDRSEFDLYASMVPAKEIGGDFYDFFLIDDDHLALVIADVSGKGIPAAMFMMVSKVAISNHALLMSEPEEIFYAINNAFSAGNGASMFVTAWLGILEISTGMMTCCNAGHEYPVITCDGKFELLHDDHGLVLGAMEDVPYSQYVLQLRKGDTIFVYTDGVPEARNNAGDFYGTERLTNTLNTSPEGSAESLVEHLKDDVKLFVDGAEQFDDLTVLALRYLG